MSRMVVRDYLELMEAQREAVFRDLANVSMSDLWNRPQPGKWSAGEHLDHTRVLNRFFRRVIRGLWPFFLPIAKLRSQRPYATEIDDIYQRPNMPSRVGVLWPPHYGPDRLVSLGTLQGALAEEHQRIAEFFRDKDERLLGNAYLWDPPIGWLNLIQALRVGIHHDEHHYVSVRRVLRQ